MDVSLDASTKTKLREIIQRMNAGEKGLHSKIVGPIKIFRIETLPLILKQQLKIDLKKGSLVFLKRYGGILLCERKTL